MQKTEGGRKRTWVLAAVGVVGLLLGLLWLYKGSGGSNPPGSVRMDVCDMDFSKVGPADGHVQRYDFEVDSRSDIDIQTLIPGLLPGPAGEEGRLRVHVESRGELVLKYYRDPLGYFHVGGEILNLMYMENGERVEARDLPKCPFFFSLDRNGGVSGLRFAADIPGGFKAFIGTILHEMQFVLPEQRGCKWLTQEEEPSGTYEAAYEIAGMDGEHQAIRFEKRILRYLTTKISDLSISPAAVKCTIEVEEDLTRGAVSLETVLVDRIDHRHKVRILSGAQDLGESERHFSMVSGDRGVPDDLPVDFAGLKNRVLSCLDQEHNYYKTDAKLDALARGLALDRAIELFLELRAEAGGQNKPLAEEFLLNYLRLNPDAAADLIDSMDTGRGAKFDQDTEWDLWRIVSEVGHPEAQKALIGAFLDGTKSKDTRGNAINALFNVKYPQSFLIDELFGIYLRGNSEGRESIEAEFHGTALYAIGALGSPDRLNAEIRPRITSILRERLIAAQDAGEQMIVLGAVGNFEGAELVGDVRVFFSNPEPRVRIAAYDAISRVDDPTVFPIIREEFRREESEGVKKEVMRFVERMPPNEEIMAFANEEVLNEASPEVQARLVDMLGKNAKKYPGNTETLEGLRDMDLPRNVKVELYKYILPRTPSNP